FEGRARWARGSDHPLAAADFLPAAEDGELMERIGQVVVRAACVQTQEWRTGPDQLRELSICVNLSPAEFRNPRLAVDVASALIESGLDAGRLILEVTEEVVGRDAQGAVATMAELRRLGVRFALDGFGAGRTARGQRWQ